MGGMKVDAPMAPGSKKPGIGDAGVMPGEQKPAEQTAFPPTDSSEKEPAFGMKTGNPIVDGLLKQVEENNKKMNGGGVSSSV
jgi:hypothetical protein